MKPKRSSAAPVPFRGRSTKGSYITASQSRRFPNVRPERPYENTGAFGSLSRPKRVGVSDEVAYSNRMSAQAARRAERAWLKSLPKGVKI